MSIDIEYQKKRLLIKYPFFRSTIAKLKFVEDVNCLGYNGQPTAGTNNKIVAYHPDFMNSLDEDEQLFILAHEVGHVALNHVFRSDNRDRKIWNIATDAVLNANLIKDGLKFVKGGVNIIDAINYDAETLYNILIELKEKTTPNNNENNSKSTTQKGNNSLDGVNIKDLNLNDFNENEDVGFDTHNMWNDAVKKSKCGNQDSKDNFNNTDNKQSFLEKLFKNSKDLDSVDEHEETQNDTSSMGEQEAFKQNREEKKKLLKELRDSFASKSMNSGDQSSQSVRNIDNIGTSISLIDWRNLLNETLNFDVDWTSRNCTIEDGVVTSHLEEIPTPETEIVLDTSGSDRKSVV